MNEKLIKIELIFLIARKEGNSLKSVGIKAKLDYLCLNRRDIDPLIGTNMIIKNVEVMIYITL